jgi:hypothetical protein
VRLQIGFHDLGARNRYFAQNLIRAVFVRRNDFAYDEVISFTQDRCDFQTACNFVVGLDFDDAPFQCDGDKSLDSRSRNLQLSRYLLLGVAGDIVKPRGP